MDRRTFFKTLGVTGVFGLSEITAKAQPENKSHKYSKFIHRGDEATMDEFRQISIIDEKGLTHHVPLIWADDEKAKEVVTGNYYLGKEENIIRLPLLNVFNHDITFDGKNIHSHYKLTARTLYKDDMDQVVEQILLKFYPSLFNNTGEYRLKAINNNYTVDLIPQVKWFSFDIDLKLDGTP